MAKTGPKPLPEYLKEVRGTNQPCRATAPIIEPVEGEPICPTWLKGQARKIWDTKVVVYKTRKQAVKGCEDTLAQYCALEADLIRIWRKKETPPIAMLNAYRIFAGEFYDTPASQQVKVGGKSQGRFSNNGRKPGG